jgi:hypothetical protein
MAIKERLARFMRKELEQVPFATSFILRVYDVDGRENLIKRFPVPKSGDPKHAAEAIATEVFEMGQDVARSMVGLARFRLLAKVTKGEFRAQFPFVLRGSAQLPLGEGGPGGMMPGMVTESEPATPTGIVGQAMRHNEALMRMMIESMGAMTEGLRQENEALRSRVVRAEEVWQQGREKLEDLMDRSMDRDIKAQKELAGLQHREALVGKLVEEVIPQVSKQIPSVMKHFGMLGSGEAKELPPDVTNMRNELREILGSLPEDAAKTLQEKLPPEKLARLAELLM